MILPPLVFPGLSLATLLPWYNISESSHMDNLRVPPLLVLPTNIRLGCKGFLWTLNILANLSRASVGMRKKSFIKLIPGMLDSFLLSP